MVSIYDLNGFMSDIWFRVTIVKRGGQSRMALIRRAIDNGALVALIDAAYAARGRSRRVQARKDLLTRVVAIMTTGHGGTRYAVWRLNRTRMLLSEAIAISEVTGIPLDAMIASADIENDIPNGDVSPSRQIKKTTGADKAPVAA